MSCHETRWARSSRRTCGATTAPPITPSNCSGLAPERKEAGPSSGFFSFRRYLSNVVVRMAPFAPERREARHKEQRKDQADDPHHHQDHADRVDVHPGCHAEIQGEGKDRTG